MKKLPELFQSLLSSGVMQPAQVLRTCDGFAAVTCPLSELLKAAGVDALPDEEGGALVCDWFFDDWHLYAVEEQDEWVCSLFKLREQEHDAEEGIRADADAPSVSVSFIALNGSCLLRGLQSPTTKNLRALAEELNRVILARGMRHHPVLKRYFCRTDAHGSGLIAALYVQKIAALSQNGTVSVPEGYKRAVESGRLPAFLEENNKRAGRTVCDGSTIVLHDPQHLSEQEKLAILATHTGNTSLSSFAAEIRFHALFLQWWARIPIPFLGRSAYDSAIRADLSIEDSEPVGPTPYYNEKSRLVRSQRTEWETVS